MRIFFREGFVYLHRYLGLSIAGFLIMSGITGSIIAFESELDAWLNPGLFEIAESGQEALSPSELVARIAKQNPYVHVYYIPVAGTARKAIVVYVEPETNAETGEPFAIDYDELFVNPVTGEIKGQRMWGKCCLEKKNLIPVLYKLHNRLMLPKPWGSRLLGTVALLWLLMSIIGIYLTLPGMSPFIKNWKEIWTLKWKRPALRGILQLHRAGGLWFCLAFLSMAITGASINLEKELFKPIVGSLSSFTDRNMKQQTQVGHNTVSFDEAIAEALQQLKLVGIIDWHAADITYSSSKQHFKINFVRHADYGLGPATVHIDANSGSFLGLSIPGTGTSGDFLYDIRLPLHSGRIAGLPGRLLVAITGLFLVMLAGTGILMWFKKRN